MKRFIGIILFAMLILGLTGCDLTGNQTGSVTGVASVKIDEENEISCSTFAEAWKKANDNPDSTVVITLNADVSATNQNQKNEKTEKKFGEYSTLTLAARSKPLTLDLNNHTISKEQRDYLQTSNGRVFTLTNAGDITIKNGCLTGGYVTREGGCILVNNPNLDLKLENVTIKRNKAKYGGAMVIYNAKNVSLTDCKLQDNYVFNDGGAVYMSKGCTSSVTMKDVMITGNEASDGSGGAMAVYGSGSTLTMDSVTISGNQAARAPGIYWKEEYGKMVFITMKGTMKIVGNRTNNFFNPNNEDLNANIEISCTPNGQGKMSVKDILEDSVVHCAFKPSATDVLATDAPADLNLNKIFCSDTADCKISAKGSELSFVCDPQAGVKLDGGNTTYFAAFADAWKYVDDNPDKEAVITLIKNVKAENNKFGDYTELTLKDRTASVTLDMNGFTIDKALKDSVLNGRIFVFVNAGCLTIKNGTLTGANNGNTGGCMLVDGKDFELHLENVKIQGNISSYDNGGGMYISLAKEVTLTDCEIKDNTAKVYGGGIYTGVHKSMVYLTNVKISENKAGENGGGMYLLGSDAEITLKDVTVTGNSARYAGGIHFDAKPTDNEYMAKLSLSGKVIIKDNTSGEQTRTDNLWINKASNGKEKLNIIDLDKASEILLSFESRAAGIFTNELGEKAEELKNCFISDIEERTVVVEGGALKLK